MSSGSELVPDCVEVVDFAVEHDPDFPVGRAHRLLPAAEVDNSEPAVAHDGAVEALLPVLVRPPVADGSIHPAQQRLIGQTIASPGISENETAHQPIPNGNRGSIVTMRRSAIDRCAASSACADTRKLSV